MVDTERIAQYVNALDRVLIDWHDFRQRVTYQDILNKRDVAHRVCYVMIVAIQASIDLASHLIAECNFPRPDTYRENFTVLKQAGFLKDSKMAGRLEELAGFRNFLVHRYVSLNYKKVHRNLVRGLAAMLYFRKTVARFARSS